VPIYEYQCSECGHRFDLRQGFDAATSCPCPKCNSIARRLFNSVAVIYKGSGFYTTDYKRKESGFSENGSGDSKKSEEKAAGTHSHKED